MGVQIPPLPLYLNQVLDKLPILNYRINTLKEERHVRGLRDSDCNKCWLAIDDMATAGGYHFPCIIYMREGGDPVGKVGPNMRQEREERIKQHDSQKDPICKAMCLDVCIDYNNKAAETH